MRRHDWADRMFSVIDAHQSVSFEWGVNDCCLFATRVIDAMTDGDIAEQILTRYHDEPTGKALIAEYGSLQAVTTHYYGEPSSERPTRGDLVLVDGGLGDALGICVGGYVLCMGPDGLRKLPRSEIRACWKT